VNETILLHNTDVKFVQSKLKNIQAIYNPTSFPILPIPQENKKNIITVVGSTKRYIDKGFDIVLFVWQKLSKNYPNWELHIIGGGSEQNEYILKQIACEYEISKTVIFTGFVKDVEKRLQDSAIFLLPSRVEGFPMVINEAISQGCACASFSLQGVMNELYSDEAVLISRDGDVDNFTMNLKKMLDSIELRKALVKKAQEEILRYQSKEIVKDWITLIEKYRKS
jgi:glycosyltransferase involved in cell wall biosynthesis